MPPAAGAATRRRPSPPHMHLPAPRHGSVREQGQETAFCRDLLPPPNVLHRCNQIDCLAQAPQKANCVGAKQERKPLQGIHWQVC